MKGIRSSMSEYNVKHEVVPNFGDLKMMLSCIRPDVEIRYTTDGSEPHEYSMLYRRPLIIKQSQTVKCATFKDGKRVGQILAVPVHVSGVTGRNVLRSTSVERRLVNGVRGSLKNTDDEWTFWKKNDSIAVTIDVGARKRLGKVSLGYLNHFGLGIHKPQKVEVWLSDNDVHYWKATEQTFGTDEIFAEGRFTEEMEFIFKDVARYVRVIMKGARKCPEHHVRPGLETQIYLDEVLIE